MLFVGCAPSSVLSYSELGNLEEEIRISCHISLAPQLIVNNKMHHIAVVGNLWLASQIWQFSRLHLAPWLTDKTCVEKQRIPPIRLSKVKTGVVRFHIARQSIGQVSAESDDFALPCDTNIPLYGSHGITL